MNPASICAVVVDDSDMDRYIICRKLSHLGFSSISQYAETDSLIELITAQESSKSSCPAKSDVDFSKSIFFLDFFIGDTTSVALAKVLQSQKQDKNSPFPMVVLHSSAQEDELIQYQVFFDKVLNKSQSVEELENNINTLIKYAQ